VDYFIYTHIYIYISMHESHLVFIIRDIEGIVCKNYSWLTHPVFSQCMRFQEYISNITPDMLDLPVRLNIVYAVLLINVVV
jgi:hypothetical protein